MRIPKKGELVYIKQLHPFDEYKYPYFEAFGVMGDLYPNNPMNLGGYFKFSITEPNIVHNRRRMGRHSVYQNTGLTWRRIRTVSFQKLKLLVRNYNMKKIQRKNLQRQNLQRLSA